MNKNITIIIPIYNEKDNIISLLKGIILEYEGINILVINDGSNDGVISYLNNIKYKKFKFINNDINKGLTFSIIKGIMNVNTNYFIVMDGDFQHPVKYIFNFKEGFKKGFEIVIGNRKNIFGKFNFFRNFISILGNICIYLKLGTFKIKDPLTGFFGGKTIIFKENINKNKQIFISKGYKFLFEFLKIIKFKKYNIYNFSFNFGKRKLGKSKLGFREYKNFILGIIK